MFVYLDIETIPSQRNESRERAASKVAPPGNITKPETLQKWNEEKRPALEEQEWAKTSLDGGWGEIACICWAVSNEAVQEATRPTLEDSEGGALAFFFDSIVEAQDASHGRYPTWVGHNITGFDLRFLWQRSVVLGINPIKLNHDATPWSGKVVDTMRTWAGTRGFTKLTDLCEALRIDVGFEDTIDGSQVWETYKKGDFQTVLNHCRADVERVRQVHKRMMFERVA